MNQRSWSSARAAGLAGLALAAALSAPAAAARTLAYVWPNFSSSSAWLVDWNTRGRAHIGTSVGGGDGTYTEDGTQRVLTLTTPISVLLDSLDCNGLPFQQRTDYRQFIFRGLGGTARSGSAAVVEIGTTTDIGGCTPGQVVPFGSPDDPGVATNYLDMAFRAPVTDLLPGVQLVGLSEDPYSVVTGTQAMTQQAATLGASRLTFAGSGNSYPYTVVDQWLAYTLPAGASRRYTRLTRDARSGIETWLGADWIGTQVGPVWLALVTKARAGATFGTVKQAAHVWTSGLFIGSATNLEYDLYRNFTGQRVITDANGTTVSPVTWAFSGNNLQTSRTVGNSQRLRTWVPVATYGLNHFVLEEETLFFSDGSSQRLIPPRLNYYVDGGPATPPPSAQR